MEISIKMTITLGGGVSSNCIYYTIFLKVFVSPFVYNPSLYANKANDLWET